VSEWDKETGDWANWKNLKPSEEIRQLYKNILIIMQGREPLNKEKKDYEVLGPKEKGYTLKQGYDMLNSRNAPTQRNKIWGKIWSGYGLPKIKSFC